MSQIVAERIIPAPDAAQPPAVVAANQVPDLTALPNLTKAWKKLRDETKEIQTVMKEKKTQMKALEAMILQAMKQNNIGALDLRNSGGRILYRRKPAKESLGTKNMSRLLGEALKSEQKATEALNYVNGHRGSTIKESLEYEQLT